MTILDRWELTCCGQPVAVRASVQEVRVMPNPPRTADRWLVTVRYQCMGTERHVAERTITTDDPEWYRELDEYERNRKPPILSQISDPDLRWWAVHVAPLAWRGYIRERRRPA